MLRDPLRSSPFCMGKAPISLLARAWARAGRCDRAIPHATAARDLYPNHPAPAQLLRACGVRKRR